MPYFSPNVAVLACKSTNCNARFFSSQLDDSFYLTGHDRVKKWITPRKCRYIHFQLALVEFCAVVYERNLKEFVLPDEDDVVVPDCVKFLCSVCRFSRVTRGMKAISKSERQNDGSHLNDVDLQPFVGGHGKRCPPDLFWLQGSSEKVRESWEIAVM